MTQTDLEALLEMGFERPRAELAVKKTGNLNSALQWLEDNQDKPLEDLQAAAAAAAADEDDDAEAAASEIKALEEGQTAKSLVCNECGKLFKNPELASYHAAKSQHTDFSESTEEIKPLTEEERKARLEELREKLQAKRATLAEQEKEGQKRNDQIKRKATKESQEIKEELQRKEQIKEAARKRQEKLDDVEAKKRIKAKIEADKRERQRKADEAKAAREGRALPAEPVAAAAAPAAAVAAAAAAAAPRTTTNHSEARLRLQTTGGNMQKTFPAETTLFEVAQALEAETGAPVTSLTLTFPRKVFEGSMDFSKTLKEAGLVPSAVLIVK